MKATFPFFLIAVSILVCVFTAHAEVKPGTYPGLHTGQNFSGTNQDTFFDDSRILDIYITISPGAFKNVMEPRLQVNREQVYARIEELRIGDLVVSNVGIRARGRTSWYKINFKLSFDADTLFSDRDAQAEYPANKKRHVFGVSKLNLRASANDPTLLREQVATDIFQEAQALSCRMGFARVYINGKYWGLYNTVEQPDEDFIKARFKGKVGHLYKGGYPAKFTTSSANMFVIKTSKNDTNRQTLIREFFSALKNAQTKEDLEKWVDIESVLDYMAAGSLTGHWDSFLFNPNNDYLYRHSDGKWYIIAWDLDNTFGSGIGWGFPVLNTSIFKMKENANYEALFDKILAVPEWNKLYRAKVAYLLGHSFEPGVFKANVEKYKKLIAEAVKKDTKKKGDWPGISSLADSNEVWEQSFTKTPELWRAEGFNGYDKGLLGWQQDRWKVVKKQLK